MRANDRLSWPQIATWTSLGMGTGLVAGFALSEWVGGVTGGRMRRQVERLRHPGPRAASPTGVTPAAAARSVAAAFLAEPRLAGITVDALPAGRGCVELRGWVPSRASRTLALRIARGVGGVDGVINNLLVRGEDDRAVPDAPEPTDSGA